MISGVMTVRRTYHFLLIKRKIDMGNGGKQDARFVEETLSGTSVKII